MSIIQPNEPKKEFPKAKTAALTNFIKIRDEFFAFKLKCEQEGLPTLPLKGFFEHSVYPLLTDEEKTFYGFQTFRSWTMQFRKKLKKEEFRKNLLEREQGKKISQIEIRQEATDLMGDFLSSIRRVAGNLDKVTPEELKKQNINPLVIYKIIREEEDRQANLRLKERSENRADMQFAFMVAMTKAGQLTEEDIFFLNEDIKKELLMFKQQDGTYQLPDSTSVAEILPAPESSAPEPTQPHPEGIA